MTSSSSLSSPAARDSRNRPLAAGLVLAVTLVAFETTAVITALPTITDELGGDSLYGAALASYLLADLVSLVAAGEMADRRGPRRPFVLSVVTFVVGLVVAAAASSMLVVVLGRVLQGAGAGGLASISYVIVRRAFPEERQPGMYALLSAGWVLPSLVAPAVSGLLTDTVGWRWVFLALVPLAVAVAALTARAMAHLEADGDAGAAQPSRIPAAALLAVSVGVVIAGLQTGRPLVAIPLAMAGSIAAAPAFRRLTPPGVVRARRGLPAVLAVRTLATATFLGVDSFVPLAADRIHGAPSVVQGFTIVGAALMWTVGQAIAARRRDWSASNGATIGFVLLLAGVVMVAPVLRAGWPLPAVFAAWAVGGLGMGILFNPTTVAAMTYAEVGREGTVAGQVHLADSLGFALMGGIGGATVALADRTTWSLTAALATNFALAAACALVGLFASREVRGAG